MDSPAFGPNDLDCIYRLPNPNRSLEDFNRSRHWDLLDLSDGQLAREGRVAQHRADLDPDPARAAWLCGRVAAVGAELATRARRAEAPAPRAITWGRGGGAAADGPVARPALTPVPVRGRGRRG